MHIDAPLRVVTYRIDSTRESDVLDCLDTIGPDLELQSSLLWIYGRISGRSSIPFLMSDAL